MKFLGLSQKNSIGFSFLIDRLKVITPYGLERKRNIREYKKGEEELLLKELNNIEAIINDLNGEPNILNEINGKLLKIKDIRNSIKRCKKGEILDDIELYEIKIFAMISDELMNIINKYMDNVTDIDFKPLMNIYELLDPGNLKIPTFYIYDDYSKKLSKIRKQKKQIEDKIIKEKELDKLTKLKSDRLKLVICEEDEEQIVRKYISNNLKNNLEEIEININSIGHIDFLIAKSLLSLEYGGIKPQVSKNFDLVLEEMVNPEIKEVLLIKEQHFTPITIRLKSGTTLITGANMGGKSITLKTVVLNAMLFQSGFFVYAKKAILPIFDFIGFISDDMQNMEQGLSTFGAEIIKLKQIIEYCKAKKGLIVLDEFARGTNIEEGQTLVKTLCKYLNKFETITLLSTHYDEVEDNNMTHYQVVGLKNVDFESLKRGIDLNKEKSIEIIQESMDYRIEIVNNKSEVPRDALNICTLLGFEEEIVQSSRELLKKNGNKM